MVIDKFRLFCKITYFNIKHSTLHCLSFTSTDGRNQNPLYNYINIYLLVGLN